MFDLVERSANNSKILFELERVQLACKPELASCYWQQNAVSAAEVEKDGLDLGDGQAMLLKKIEELTLHLIEMDKKLNQLSAENAAMKKKLDK